MSFLSQASWHVKLSTAVVGLAVSLELNTPIVENLSSVDVNLATSLEPSTIHVLLTHCLEPLALTGPMGLSLCNIELSFGIMAWYARTGGPVWLFLHELLLEICSVLA